MSAGSIILVLKWQYVYNRQLRFVSGTSFLAAHNAYRYSSTNKTNIV